MATKRENRLPTLNEVLRRATAPPVDLYCYYIFLQREGAEDTLDFWLDVAQHESLCKAYFKDLRKSGRSVREDWPAYYDLARRRGSIYNGNINGITRGEYAEDEEEKLGKTAATGTKEGRNDSFLKADTNDRNARTPSPNQQPDHSGVSRHFSPTLARLYPDAQTPPPQGRKSSQSFGRRTSTPAQAYISRNTAITRHDLLASAERIYARYLLAGSSNEIYLPPSLRIHTFPLSASNLPEVSFPQSEIEAEQLAKIPDMFNLQKEYVYRAMEQDTFPRFLRAKAFGNLTAVGALGRLGVGLLALWAGFSTALALIFLDSKPKERRLYVIIPFAVAILFILSHSYDLDPIMVLLNRSETTPFKTIEIREPYVKKLLLGRSIWVISLTIIVVAILTVIFWAVPGHRL
ncbi:regulator of G protein signaling superfamily [Atractiella rhizophila]|nr:regulator of G protein signaling superfamily [Atractiella rhizophila]